jgi:MoaE-MoaD fusion protein
MEVTVRFFANLKDLIGQSSVRLPLPLDSTVNGLRADLAERYPAVATALPSAIAAVNQEYAFGEHPLKAGDEVAFFPPVSGGGWPEYFALQEGAVDLNDLTARIVVPATGAVALFSGFVRGETTSSNNDGNGEIRQTLRLEYEAYEPMALAKMRQVAAEIREQWPDVQGIAIVQSIGVLEVGQATVLIACGAGHRDQGCFEAARYGIDRLKEIVPVWKKEIGREGEAWVSGHYVPSPEDRAENI